MKETTKAIIDDLKYKLPKLFDIQPILDTIELINITFLTNSCYESKILICGNGGSAADAQHIVGELMKSFLIKRKLDSATLIAMQKYPDDYLYFSHNIFPVIPAISLSEESCFISAYNNDCNSDLVYAQQVYGYGNSEDILLAISTSGNSKNIIYAAKMAKIKGMPIIALTGENGGELKNHADITIKAPSNVTHIVQEYHIIIYHAICAALENEFFGE